MLQDDIDYILRRLTNFYNTFAPDDPALTKFINIYGQSVAVLWEFMLQADKNTYLPEAPTLRRIPYFKLDVQAGIYSVTRAKELVGMDFENMITSMDRAGQFIEVIFSSEVNRTPLIYGLQLKVHFALGDPLALYTDYFVRNNRIYLLPNFIISNNQPEYLHAFDILVDDKTLEKNWGSIFDLELGPLLPRFEYKEALQSFDKAFASDLMISEIKTAIQSATNWTTFNLYDYYSPDLPQAKKRMYDSWLISPFQFIVSIPEAIIYDKVKINILLHLLDEVKESQTNYLMFYDIVRNDLMTTDEKVLGKYIWLPNEVPSLDDASKLNQISMKCVECMFLVEEYNHYDDQAYFDLFNRHDVDDEADYDSPNTLSDEDSFDSSQLYRSDYFTVTVRDFPEIPRQFAATQGNPGEITFTCRPNYDGTIAMQLYGATEVDGEYDYLDQVSNDPKASSLSLFHNANQSGKRYYKMRAIVGNFVSLMTLPIDIQTL